MSTTPAFDAEWFPLIKPIVFSVSEVQPITKGLHIPDEQRELFLHDEVENPLFTYRQTVLDTPTIDTPISELLTHMRSANTHAVVVELYEKKTQRQLARQALLAATRAGCDQQFFKESKVVYGVPKKEYASYVAARVLALCNALDTAHPVSAKRLRTVLAKIDRTTEVIDPSVLPDPVLDSPRITSQQQVRTIFTETIERLELSGWSLNERTDTHNHFAVVPESRQILIPQEAALLARTDLTEIKVRALAEHEIGVHVLRSVHGSTQPLKLLEIGLHDYLGGEEGVAAYVQQQTEGAEEFYGFDRYLGAILAHGRDGTPRDFRGVFQLLRDYYTLRLHDPKKPPTEDMIIDAAWNVAIRIFRGTTGTTPGCFYTKDILYLENNIEVWNLLIEKPQRFESLFIGKYNPLLTHHITALQTLEILKEW